MITKYLNYSIIIDFVLCLLLGIVTYTLRPQLSNYFVLPEMDSILRSMDSMIKVATPLIGFMLTIVGIIVTFKNNFDSQKPQNANVKEIVNDPYIPPTQTVFDQTVSAKEQFYKTDLHLRVMNVFLKAVYEFSLIVFLFLIIQCGFFEIDKFWIVLFETMGFMVLVLAMFRSLYIYRLFLNVHIK